MSPVLRVSTNILWGFSWDRWENIHFSSKPRHVTPQNQSSQKHEPCSEGFNTHLWGFQEDRWGNIHFESKPRHVTPQINCLRKMSPTLRVSTHIYGVSKEIDGKMFILKVNLGMWPLKWIVLAKQALFWGFNTHLWGFQGNRWENVYFESKPRHVTPHIDCLGKTSPVLRVQIPIYAVSKKIDGKMFILRLNLGMWPLKINRLRKLSPVLRVSTNIYGVSKEIDGKTSILIVSLKAHIGRSSGRSKPPWICQFIWMAISDFYCKSSYNQVTDLPRWGVLRERPFTREGNYLVSLFCD